MTYMVTYVTCQTKSLTCQVPDGFGAGRVDRRTARELRALTDGTSGVVGSGPVTLTRERPRPLVRVFMSRGGYR